MKTFNVKYSGMFFDDLKAIVQYIFEQSGHTETARLFYENVLDSIEKRAFGADSFEKFQPYAGAPDYYRIYFGHYTIFYVLSEDEMEVRRILWSGRDLGRFL